VLSFFHLSLPAFFFPPLPASLPFTLPPLPIPCFLFSSSPLPSFDFDFFCSFVFFQSFLFPIFLLPAATLYTFSWGTLFTKDAVPREPECIFGGSPGRIVVGRSPNAFPSAFGGARPNLETDVLLGAVPSFRHLLSRDRDTFGRNEAAFP